MTVKKPLLSAPRNSSRTKQSLRSAWSPAASSVRHSRAGETTLACETKSWVGSSRSWENQWCGCPNRFSRSDQPSESNKEGSPHKAATDTQGLHRYSSAFRKSSRNSGIELCNFASDANLKTGSFGYWLAGAPDSLKVSGGSKKHWCHSAASDNFPAFHC